MTWWDRLKASVGLSREKASAKARGGLIGPVPLGWQLSRIGGSLTPAQVSSILRDADTGRMSRLIDLENEARQKDCHLHAILDTREQAVAGLEYEVTAFHETGKDAKARDERVATWCADVLASCDQFPTMLAHLSGAVYHGYAVAESVFEKRDGDVVPCAFSLIAPRRFIFDNKTLALRWWDEAGSMPYPGVDIAATYPGRFLIHQPRVNGDIPPREGLGRVLMWAALFRNWNMRDWLSLAELAWKPWRWGKYVKGASSEDIDALEEALDKMSTSGVATLPETTDLEVHFPAGTGKASTHEGLANYLGAEMSKAVLGATTTVEQGARGALALGKVHNEVRKDRREADARQLAATLRRDLLAPMVAMNWGPTVRVPQIRFLTEDAIDLEAYSKAIATLQSAGLSIPTAHVYDVSGIPMPQDDEETLEAPAPPLDPNKKPPSGEGEEAPEPAAGEQPNGDKPPAK